MPGEKLGEFRLARAQHLLGPVLLGVEELLGFDHILGAPGAMHLQQHLGCPRRDRLRPLGQFVLEADAKAVAAARLELEVLFAHVLGRVQQSGAPHLVGVEMKLLDQADESLPGEEHLFQARGELARGIDVGL